MSDLQQATTPTRVRVLEADENASSVGRPGPVEPKERLVMMSTPQIQATPGNVTADAEDDTVVSRLDQARVDRLLAEHDPFRGVAR